MNFRVKRVAFHNAIPCLGSRAWIDHIKQGGVKAVEYNDVWRMVELDAPSELIRVPLEAVAELVIGPTVPNKK